MKLSGPGFAVRLEDVAGLVGSVLLYSKLEAGWGYFALLFLVPDLFMAGYAVNKTVGAVVYNIGHTYSSPVFLAAVGYAMTPSLYPIALISAEYRRPLPACAGRGVLRLTVRKPSRAPFRGARGSRPGYLASP
jgi:hypothetical protein